MSGRMSIGEVLRRLQDDFPDVTISKIRFLEAEGLVEPQRSPSGYRKFSSADVERLRYVLTAQRDHYLPLRVIREHLDAMARGLEPPTVAGEAPRAPRTTGRTGAPAAVEPRPIRMSRTELLANSGLDGSQLDELEGYGIVHPIADDDHYDSQALTVAESVAALARHGLEPRHLRLVKTAADRQAGLVDQVVAPLARQRDDGAVRRASDLRDELGRLVTDLHAALLADAVKRSD